MRSWNPAQTLYGPKGLECQVNQIRHLRWRSAHDLGVGLKLNQGHPIDNAHGCRQEITRIRGRVLPLAILGHLAAAGTSATGTTEQHSSGIRHLVSQLVHVVNIPAASM